MLFFFFTKSILLGQITSLVYLLINISMPKVNQQLSITAQQVCDDVQ